MPRKSGNSACNPITKFEMTVKVLNGLAGCSFTVHELGHSACHSPVWSPNGPLPVTVDSVMCESSCDLAYSQTY